MAKRTEYRNVQFRKFPKVVSTIKRVTFDDNDMIQSMEDVSPYCHKNYEDISLGKVSQQAASLPVIVVEEFLTQQQG